MFCFHTSLQTSVVLLCCRRLSSVGIHPSERQHTEETPHDNKLSFIHSFISSLREPTHKNKRSLFIHSFPLFLSFVLSVGRPQSINSPLPHSVRSLFIISRHGLTPIVCRDDNNVADRFVCNSFGRVHHVGIQTLFHKNSMRPRWKSEHVTKSPQHLS